MTLWTMVRFPDRGPSENGGFADDVLDVAVGIDVSTVRSIIQKDTQVFLQWAREHGLTFSPGKTKAMLITNRKNVCKGIIYLDKQPVDC